MATQSSFHLKYRPKLLDQIIGHENAVTQLTNIIKSKRWPNAILFTGPTSAGKTTLARAFAATACGLEGLDGSNKDYYEINAADNRTIDDMRQLIQLSKLKPMHYPKRFILLDEAQGILGVPASVQALLSPLESPPTSTMWMFTSMEPEKFLNTAGGRALMNRCLHIQLKPHTEQNLYKQAVRIVKGEGRRPLFTKETLRVVVDHCGGEMRTLANLLQLLISSVDGDSEEVLEKGWIEERIAKNFAAADDLEVVVVRFLVAIYSKAYGAALREVLNTDDVFSFLMKCQSMLRTVIMDYAVKGERHSKVWVTKPVAMLIKNLVKDDNRLNLPVIIGLHSCVTKMRKNPATAFNTDDLVELVSDMQAIVGGR